MSFTDVLAVASVSVLGVSALLVLWRIVRGPTVLDRVIGIDVLVAIVVAGLALEAAINRHSSTLPVLIALSLLGFVGAVSVARFVARDDDVDMDQPGERSSTLREGGS